MHFCLHNFIVNTLIDSANVITSFFSCGFLFFLWLGAKDWKYLSFSTHRVLQNIIGNKLEQHDLDKIPFELASHSNFFHIEFNFLDKFHPEACSSAFNVPQRTYRLQLSMFTNSGYSFSSWFLWSKLSTL